jgi:hypothetical protein
MIQLTICITIFFFFFNNTISLYPLWPKLVLISVHSWFNFMPFASFVVNNNIKSLFSLCPLWPNCKTNPKRTQTNPIFQGSIFDFKPKTRISTIFTQHFLCKTNPICSGIYAMKGMIVNRLWKVQIHRKGLTGLPDACMLYL